MPTIPQGELPRPKSWDEFEDIVWDLYARAWDDPNAQRCGRSGQAQQGVDIYGQPSHLTGGYAGVQCKRYEPGKLTQSVIEAEIAKAETFDPPLAEYTIATTHPRDATVQRVIRDLNKERTKKSQFPLHIVFWEDICSQLLHPDNRDLLRKHYGDWLSADFATRPTPTAEECRELERAYLKRVADECHYLYTEGVDRVRAELTEVFVMLQAVQSPRRKERMDVAPVPMWAEEMGLLERLTDHRALRKEKQPEQSELPPLPSPPLPLPVPLSKALAEHEHLVILGEPGTGKSTTLQFVALCFAKSEERWPRQRLDLDEDRVPVRVELRQYDGQERLDRFLVRWLDRQAYVPEVLTQEWLEEGRLAILLDGLDEVPQERRGDVARALESFAASTKGKACRIVISSRIGGYLRIRELVGEFGHYTMCPFADTEDALRYTAGWLQLLRRTTDEEAKAEAQDLLAKMEGQTGLRRVRGNPLLLRLIVSIYVKSGQLAHNRAEVYRRYVDEVVWQREEAREHPRWSRETIEATVEALAWTLQIHGEQTESDLAQAVIEAVKGVADARHLIHYLRERLGLLAVHGYERGELLTFRYLSFREYFVARRLARDWGADKDQAWRFLRPRLHHRDWREPILLLATMLQEVDASELLRHIINAESPFEPELHRDLLLAGTCIAHGSEINDGLRRTILDRLLSLYLRETAFETALVAQQPLARTIEQTLESMGDDARAEIVASLLTIVKGENIAVRRILTLLRTEARRHRQRVAMRTLRALNLRTPETTTALMAALQNVSISDAAAEALGELGPGTIEVATALLEAYQRMREAGYSWEARRKVLLALGAVAQRHVTTTRHLLSLVMDPEADPANVRFVAAFALCKAAETQPEAMAFIVEGRWNLYASQPGLDSQAVPLHESIHAGLKNGLVVIGSASEQVIHYLLAEIRRGKEDRTWVAEELLEKVVGDTRLVQCKAFAADGSIKHSTLDLTDEAFDLFLRRPAWVASPSVGLRLLVKWGWNDLPIVTRLINVVKEADAWLLAHILEGWLEQRTIRRLEWPEDAIECLRSPEKDTRETAFAASLRMAELAQDNYCVANLPGAIAKTKPQILNNAYQGCAERFRYYDDERSRLGEQVEPYVVAALAVFRGWGSGSPLFSLGQKEVEDEFLSEVDQALAILQGQTGQAVSILASVLAGQGIKLASTTVEKKLKSQLSKETIARWNEESLYNPGSRAVAAYALAHLATHYPEAQVILLSNLKPHLLGEGREFFPENRVQQHLVRALGYVRDANADLVKELLDIAVRCDEDVLHVGSRALEHLRRPSPEAANFLVGAYEDLPESAQPYLLQALGTADFSISESRTCEAIILLLSALKAKDRQVRSAAAFGLGNINEPSMEVVKALLRSASRNLAAVEAMGKLAERFTADDESEIRAWLEKAARLLKQLLRRGRPSFDVLTGRSGKELAREALSRVVARLTEMDVKALQDGPPLSAPIPMRIGPLSVFLVALGVIAAAVSGLASNLIAAFPQERLGLANDAWRIAIVGAVFLLTLAVGIWLALRQYKAAEKGH